MTGLHLIVEAVGAQLPELADRARRGGAPVAGIGDFLDFAERAEDARVDGLFYADFLGKPRAQFGSRPLIPFEPLTALSAIAARTSRIGLVATASTTFAEPYGIARQIASLDNISGGRAGWNIVTSIQGAGNYGLESLPDKDERYERAAEVTDAVLALWSSWRDGYLGAGTGFVNTAAIDDVRFSGRHVAIDGWLDVPSDAQGRPVLFQAGSSASGLTFAARYADAVFGINPSRAGAIRSRDRLRALAAAQGRDPDAVRYLPGVRLFVDQEVSSVEPPGLRAGLASVLGVPLAGLDPDAPLPAAVLAARASVDTQSAAITGTAEGLWDLAAEPGTTLRELLRVYGAGSGFLTLTGSAEAIAATLLDWADAGAADGFVIGAGGSVDAVYERVLPLLRAAGRFRTDYAGRTLRAHLGGVA
ncbi:NtaA/DmoA family FMN-dependent monooxygenase [Tsukamurella sp. 1534]|uniref:NtaA/DmoA family FMN-dependent monooxygenase n=1 Tax=Tsukamurella sp. 1534 TaxID=1151061 RepID=UPI0002EFED5A|nr:NtaA/DmoA family FMN-dependent monooxygenase [Tsukamurella sp. 1534]